MRSSLYRVFPLVFILLPVLSLSVHAVECGRSYSAFQNDYGGSHNAPGSASVYAFAALKADGSISAWGDSSYGGAGAPSDSGYAEVYSSQRALAALKVDGSVRAWGDANYGGLGAPSDNGYATLFSTVAAFAALKTDGGISVWGDSAKGGAGAPSDSGYSDIYSTGSAFAALRADGSIFAWGEAGAGGTGAPSDSGYGAVYSNQQAFVALQADGSIMAWGDASAGGAGAPSDNGYGAVYSSRLAFAALKVDGSIRVWGDSSYGGTGGPVDNGYTAIYSTGHAFAALKANGSISAWGNSSSGGTGAPTGSGFEAIYATSRAFAALNADGSIRVWGNSSYGGTGAPSGNDFVAIYSTRLAFAALKSDGSIHAWGGDGGTGEPAGSGYEAVYSTAFAFAALKADGSISVWGDPSRGGSGAPSGSFVSVNGPVDNASPKSCLKLLNFTLAEVAEDIAGNANGVAVTAAQLNSVEGISGALAINQGEYTAALQAGSYVDFTRPTAAEVQTVITASNAVQAVLSEVAEDIAGNGNGVGVTATQLNSIDGISAALVANEAAYTAALQVGSYVDASRPTAAEIQVVITAVNEQQTALSEVAEDIAGNADGSAVTAVLLNSINGVSAALSAHEAEYTSALQAGSYIDVSRPTGAEIQAVITAVNKEQVALSEVAEDIAGNANGTAVTAVQLNSIGGVSGALLDLEGEYSAALQVGSYADVGHPTAAEIQAVITAVNNEQVALNEVAEDIAGNANGTAVTAVLLNSINGVSGALLANESEYSAALQAGSYADFGRPSAAEIQVVITGVNEQQAALREVIDDIAGNADGVTVTAAQLNRIDGVSGAQETLEEAYLAAFQTAEFLDPNHPSPEEIQAVIDAVNGEVASAPLVDGNVASGGGSLGAGLMIVLIALGFQRRE